MSASQKRFFCLFILSGLVLLSFGLGVFFSCTIGLGPAVDTDRPNVSFEYPNESSVIMEDFVMTGLCSDDSKVKSVILSFEDLDRKKVLEKKYEAEINQNADKKGVCRWSCEINKQNEDGTYPISDGRYQVTATVTDIADRTNFAKWTIEIDNTAPLVLLSEPISRETEPVKAFGRLFNIKGQLEETHTASSMSVYVKKYEDDAFVSDGIFASPEGYEIKIADYTSMSESSPLRPAAWYSENPASGSKAAVQKEIYEKLYGAVQEKGKNTDKLFYYSLSFSDTARIFKDPSKSEGVEAGNQSKGYYIASEEMDTLTGENSYYQLDLVKIKNILEGSETYGFKESELEEILRILSANYIQSDEITKEKSLCFTLNPDNNPVWNIANYELDDSNPSKITGNQLDPGGNFSIMFNAGKDSASIDGSSIEVKLVDITESDDENSPVVTVIEKNALSGNTSSLSFTQNISLSNFESELETGHVYRVEVSGADIDENVFSPESGKGYGFKLIPSSVKPVMTLDPIFETVIYKSGKDVLENGLTITGKVVCNGSALVSVKPEITFSDSWDKAPAFVSNPAHSENFAADPNVESGYRWEVTLSGTEANFVPAESGLYTYNITITCEDANVSEETGEGQKDSKTVSFIIDSEEPVITYREEHKPESTSLVNGKMNLSVSAEDKISGLKTEKPLTFIVYENSESNPVELPENGKYQNPKDLEIDTTAFNDGTNLIVYVTAEDNVGNIGKEKICELTVNQDTDKPELTVLNADVNLKNLEDIRTASESSAAVQNIFGEAEKLREINLKVSDDDGIGEIVYKYKSISASETSSSAFTDWSKISGKKLSAEHGNVSFVLPEANGIYAVCVSVKDIYGKTAEAYFACAVDSGSLGFEVKPSFVTILASDRYVKNNQDVLISGKCSGKNIAKLIRTYTVNGTPSGSPEEITLKADKSWNDSLKISSVSGSEIQVVYTVTDIFGKSKTETVVYGIDAQGPSVVENSDYPLLVQGEGLEDYYNVRNLILTNYWNDDFSGVTKLWYWLNDENPTVPSSAAKEGSVAVVSGKGLASVNISGLVHGENYLTLCAEDAVGNKSAYKVVSLNIDLTAPVIEKENETTIISNGKDTFELYGTVEDSGSGLSYISFMLGSKNVKIDSDGTVTGDKTELTPVLQNILVEGVPCTRWVLTVNPSDKGDPAEWFVKLSDKTVYAEAGDNAGNSSGKIIIANIAADTIPPTPVILNVTPTVEVSNESKKRINQISIVSGTANDNDDVKSVSIYYKTSANGSSWSSEKKPVRNLLKDSGDNCQVWSVQFDTTAETDGTYVQVFAEAEDYAGNKNTAESPVFVVDQNTDIPELKLTNADLEIKTIEQLKEAVENNYAIKNVWGLNGKITGTLSDDDGLKSFSAYYKKYDGESDFENEDKSKLELINIYPAKTETAGQKNYTIDFNIPEKFGYGIFQVYVVVEDIENVTVVQDFVLSVDAGIPALEITKKPSAYVNASDSLQYEGTASDENWETMTRVYKIGETVSDAVEIVPSAETGLWSDTLELSESEKYTANGKAVTVTYTAIDKLGQKHVAENSFTVDNDRPVFIQSGEKALKTGISAASLVTHNSDLWFRNNALYLSGYVDSDLSGIKEISYWLRSSDYEAEPKASPSGTVIPVKDGSFWKYQMNLSGFEQGENSMVLLATDYAGNASVPLYVTLKIDSAVPQLKGDSEYDLFLRNGKENVTISGKVRDAGSGIESVSMKFNEGNITVDNSGSLNPNGFVMLSVSPDEDGWYTWTATFICSEGGNVKSWFKDSTVTGTVTDNAGNSSSVLVSTMLVDTKEPETRILSVVPVIEAGPDKFVNRLLELEGTSSDINGIESTVLSYSVYSTASSKWEDYVEEEVFTGSLAYDWSYDFDTTKIENSDNKTTKIKFAVTALDKAGNAKTFETPEYVIDQNSDRPEIVFADISMGDMVQRNIISGSVIDDDGAVNMWYCIDDKDSRLIAEKTPTLLNTPAGWKKIAVSSTSDKKTGNWSIDLSSEDDGEKYLFFCVIDAKGHTFKTSLDSLDAPFITDKKNAKQNCLVSLTKDTKAPEITKSMELSDDGVVFDKGEKSFFGGNYKKLYARITLKETTAMPSLAKDALTLSIDGNASVPPVNVTLESNEGSSYTYKAGPLSIEGLEDGFHTIYCNVSDAAGKTVQDRIQIIIDNEAPSVTVSYPEKTLPNSGTLEMNGLVTDNVNGAGVDTEGSVFMLLPTRTQEAAGVASLSDGVWGDAISGSSSWTKSFNSTNKDSPESLSYYVENDLYGEPVINGGKETGWYDVPVWFKTVDKLGNTKVDTTNSIRIDRYAYYPNITIKNPAEGQKVGSTVTVYGTAFDNEGFDESAWWPVRVQFDANGDGVIDSADFTELNTAKWAGTEAKANLVGTASDWYVKASGTTSWRLKVDTGLIPDTKNFSVRACVYDSDGYTRGWTDIVTAVIDIDSPQITDLKLVMYKNSDVADNSFASPVLTKEVLNKTAYVSSPFPDCVWYLEGVSSDNNYVENIFIEGLAENHTMTFTEADAEEDPLSANKITRFRTKFGTSYADGIRNLNITATDNNNISTSAQGTIVIDTTAPSMFTTGNVSKASGIGDSLRITTNKGTVNYDTNTIENSNSVFTFGDKIVENTDSKGKPGSGVDFVAFYFTRGEKLYRPVASLTETIGTDNVTMVGSKNETTAALNDIFINNEGLVSKLLFVSQNALDNKKLTIQAPDKNIRNGGLVKINNRYIGIKTVNGNSVELKEDPGVASSAQFIYAQVVDHFTKESAGGNGDSRYNYISTTDGGSGLVNDDGDGMIESLENKNSLTEYEWSASVFSDYITDGPVELHVVVLDKAGNSNHGYVSSKVENKRPRITKVLMATDLNRDGKFTYAGEAGQTELEDYLTMQAGKSGLGFGEFMYYSALDNSNKASADVELNTIRNGKAGFTVKNRLLLLPEFTGGNGDLKYTMKISPDRAGAVQTNSSTHVLRTMNSKADISEVLKTEYSGIGLFDVSSQVDKAYGGILLENTELDAYDADDVTKYMAITFWDHTEGLEQGTTSQWSLLSIPLIFDTKDSIKPVATIDPFKWIDKDHNNTTGFQNSAYNGKGHIEYTEGWKKSKGYDPDATTGAYDADPKVSGVIRITGTAYDNTVLGDINMALKSFKFDGYNDYGGINFSKSVKLASYEPETDSWNYEVLFYNSSTKKYDISEIPRLETRGYEFRIIERSSPSQEGHSVKWQLDLDTSKSSRPVVLDVPCVVYATDGSKNQSELTEKSKYRMDFVPYITNVITRLSALGDDSSVFSRSSTGAYQIYAGHYANNFTADPRTANPTTETNNIVFEGYNLKNANIQNITNGKGEKTKDEVFLKTSGITRTETSATVGTNWFYSGEVNIYVAGGTYSYVNGKEAYSANANIYTLNNVNNNDEEYNYYDNEINNNHVDDDVVFDVWAARYGIQKNTSEMRYPSVKINPVNGQVGVGATDATYAYRPGYKSGETTGTYYSAGADNKNASGATYNAFTYDENGDSYGIANYVGANDLSKNGPAVLTFGVCESGDATGKNYNGYAGGQYNGVRIEAGSINTKRVTTTDPGEWTMSYTRTRNPNLVAKKQADGSTMVHLVYYDGITRQVRYRRGRILSPGSNATLSRSNGVKAFSNGASISGDTTATNTLTATKMMEAWERDGVEYKGPFFHDICDVEYKYSQAVNDKLYTDIATAKNRVNNIAGLSWAFPYHTEHTGTKGKLPATEANDFRAELPDSVMTLSGMTVNVIAGGIDAEKEEFADIYLKSSDAYMSNDGTVEYYPAHEYRYGASEYTALGVLSNGRPVIAWYEPSLGKLLLTTKSDSELTAFETAVRNAPSDETHVYVDPAGTDGIGTSLANVRLSFARTNSWENSTVEAGTGGKFVQMAVDKNDIVHMVYLDEDADQLKYTRFTVSNDGTFNFQGTWIIDGYSIDGFCTINVGYETAASLNPFVYVGYMSGGYAKSAVLRTAPADGFADHSYTGKWEIATVPTLKNISKYNVSTAEYVDTEGLLKLKGVPEGVIQTVTKNTTSGILYPNGTANPVIGYGTADGNVDIAQIR